MWIEKFQIKKDNRLAAIYPITKLWLILIYISAMLILATMKINELPLLLLFGTLILFILGQASGKGKVFRSAMGKVGFASIIIFIAQTLLVRGGEKLAQVGFLSIYQVGLSKGILLSLMVLNAGGIFVLFFQITENKEISRALEEAGMHYKASFIFISSMQMIEILGRNSKTIMNAQKARGVETEGNLFMRMKAFLPSIIPLVLSAIINTEDRVLTLSSKGFEVQGSKTHILTVEKSGDERIALLIGIIFFVVVVVGRILW